MELWAQILAFLQILLIDISLAGDNAIAVGLAASRLNVHQRKKAVIGGIAIATVLRIVFAIFAVQILQITGLLAAGGILLMWVAWKMYRDVREMQLHNRKAAAVAPPSKKLSAVIWQIAVADVSMSLDNVLGVAGVARDHLGILVVGLAISVLLMGAAANFIAKLTNRYTWIAYLGLAIVLFTALHMIWDGAHQIIRKV